jgi:hypothetical protein
MSVQHVNRRGVAYYLHEGRTRTGKPRYFFSKKKAGTLAEAVPPGYEVYEAPNAQVFLRKPLPRLVTDEEIATIERGLRQGARLSYFLIDVREEHIVVYLPNQDLPTLAEVFSPFGLKPSPELYRKLEPLLEYSPRMQFVLVDPATRTFEVQRWCFLGSIDRWIPLLGGRGDLETLVARYARHLGKESFFELF